MIAFVVLVAFATAFVGLMFVAGYWAWVEDETPAPEVDGDDWWVLFDEPDFRSAAAAGMFDVPLEELGRLRERGL